MLVVVSIVLFLHFAGSIQAHGQATETVLASLPGSSNGGLIQAGDGNFYGTTLTGGADDAGTIYKVSTAGALTVLYSFTGGADGGSPAAIIQGTDGRFYGATYGGGTVSENGLIKAGTLFSFDPDTSSLTTLHSFVFDDNGFLPAGALVEGTDGVLYGTTTNGGPSSENYPNNCGVLYSIHRDGTNYTVVLGFPGDGSVAHSAGVLLQGADGNLYGASVEGGANLDGSIFEVTQEGDPTVLWSFTGNADGSYARADPLVEGPDGSFYGTTTYSENQNQGGVVYQLPPGKSLTELHSFVDRADGFIVSGGLVWGSDGFLYGTTGYGGGTPCTSTFFNGCGTFFRVKPDGTGFQILYKFGAAPDASVPIGPPVQGSDGAFYGITTGGGTAGTGAIYRIQLSANGNSPAPSPPITLAFTVQSTGVPVMPGSSVDPNTPLLLAWNVSNAFSDTMRSCSASIQGSPEGAGAWSGLQKGTINAGNYFGSAVVIPTVAGVYTYALTCGGRESQQLTLLVGSTLSIANTFLPDGVVSQPYQVQLVVTGGKSPYTWSVAGGDHPKGLTLDPTSGVISGTPLQYGGYTTSFQVVDSSPTPLTSSVTLNLKITSGLSMILSIPGANVGKQYSATLTTTGGVGPYTWKVASGALPPGLTFNTSAGVITGTPTKAGNSTFAVTVTDVENPKATLTNSYTITTMAEPLEITDGTLMQGTEGTPYSQTLTATGGVPPYTWSATAGQKGFPKGLTLSADGVVSGTPLQFQPQDGYCYVFFNVADSQTPPAVVNTSTCLVINSSLKVTTTGLPNGTIGASYNPPVLTATGGIPPYKWQASVTPASALQWLTLVSSTGQLGGTPPEAGTFEITAYVLDSEGTPDKESAQLTLTVVAPPVATTTILSSSNAAVGTGMPVTLTATVMKSGGGPVTGTAVFYNGTVSLGTVVLNANGMATLTTSFATAGSESLTAAYSGDAGSAPSVSTPLIETVVTPTITGVVSPTILTIADGASGTLVITLTPVGGYTGTVNFSCGSLPAHISCTFAPPSLAITAGSGSATDTLTINTAAQSSALLFKSRSVQGVSLALTLWFPTVLCFGSVSRKRRFLRGHSPRLFIVFAILGGAGMFGLTGCGGSGSSSAKAGTYVVPITLSAVGGTVNLNATVVVQ